MISPYIWIALLSAGIFGLVTVLDKRLVSYELPSLSAFYMAMVVSLIGYGTIALLVTGLPENPQPDRLLAAGASSLFWGGALAMMFWGYKLEEASRASAIIHTFPVFVAILAMVFLGESLGASQWSAVVVVVLGAASISLWGSGSGTIFRLNRALPILICASLFTALALLTGKYALEELPVWFVYSLRSYGMAFMFVFLWRPGAFGQLFSALRNWRTLVVLFLAEFSLAPLAMLLNVTAVNMGPVSLVSTITATRPLFVFIYGTALSTSAFRLLEEPLDTRTLFVKLVAIGMIIGGIATLSLS